MTKHVRPFSGRGIFSITFGVFFIIFFFFVLPILVAPLESQNSSLSSTQNDAIRNYSSPQGEWQSPKIRFQSSLTSNNHDHALLPDPPMKEIPIPQPESVPLGITVDRSGNVWFAEDNTDMIVEYIMANQNFKTFHIPTNQHLAFIWFLIFDKNGYLWFADNTQPLLWRFSPSTGQFANFTTGSNSIEPFGLAYDQSSNQIWFTSTRSDQVGLFQLHSDGSAQIVQTIGLSSESSCFGVGTEPSGIALDGRGNVYIAETCVAKIIEINEGSYATEHTWDLPPGAQPVGIAFDGSRNRIWFTNHATSMFGYVDESTGKVVEISTSLFGIAGTSCPDNCLITLPYWIDVSSSGYVWFDEHVGNKIARFDPSGLQLTEFTVPTQQSAPLRFALDDSKGLVWFTEFEGNKLGVLEENSSLPSYSSTSAKAVAITPDNITISKASAAVSINVTASQISNFEGVNSSILGMLIVSGSLNQDGDISSNLTVSAVASTSGVFSLSISVGQFLEAGNFTLTICPRIAANDTVTNPAPVRQCGILFFEVRNSPTSNFENYVLYSSLAAVAIATAAAVSLLYVKRWRSA